MNLRSSLVVAVVCSSAAVAVGACTSSGDPEKVDVDAGRGDASSEASASEASTPDAAATGFQVVAATNGALVGGYDLVLHTFANAGETAYNGALPDVPAPGSSKPRIEMEIVTDAAGAVKRAHFWSYDASGTAPDKFYGCDGSGALPCAGFTLDASKHAWSFASVTWKEVTADLTGKTPDTSVAGGGSVTLSGAAQVE